VCPPLSPSHTQVIKKIQRKKNSSVEDKENDEIHMTFTCGFLLLLPSSRITHMVEKKKKNPRMYVKEYPRRLRC
jgi:hypothetical protein